MTICGSSLSDDEDYGPQLLDRAYENINLNKYVEVYVRTMHIKVAQLQRTVAERIRSSLQGPDILDEEHLLGQLEAHLCKRSATGLPLFVACSVVSLRLFDPEAELPSHESLVATLAQNGGEEARLFEEPPLSDSGSTETELLAEEPLDIPGVEPTSDSRRTWTDRLPDTEKDYVISWTGHGGRIKRLHALGRCRRVPGLDYQEYAGPYTGRAIHSGMQGVLEVRSP